MCANAYSDILPHNRATTACFGHATTASVLSCRLLVSTITKETMLYGMQQPKKPSEHVTEARSRAQRAKLMPRTRPGVRPRRKLPPHNKPGKDQQKALLAKRRARATIGHAIADYLQDHEGGNHSEKTLQWHQHGPGSVAELPSRGTRNYAGRRGGCPRYQRLVRAHAQNPWEPWQAAKRTHDPDLRPFGPRLFPLARTS